MCNGFDVMACAQTGSGKTAAFLFPMISTILKKDLPPGGNANGRSSFPRGLILAPTRELVQQIYDEARKFCYKAPAHNCAHALAHARQKKRTWTQNRQRRRARGGGLSRELAPS